MMARLIRGLEFLETQKGQRDRIHQRCSELAVQYTKNSMCGSYRDSGQVALATSSSLNLTIDSMKAFYPGQQQTCQ
jgi:hypothetical protein